MRVLVALALLTGTADAHPTHVSLAEVEHVAGALHVAMQVPMAALDRARDRLGVVGEPGALRLVRDHFVVTHKAGDRCTIKWVGLEPKVFVAWLYFEVALKGPLAAHRLSYTLFMDQAPKQVNTVLLAGDGRRATLVFVRNDATHPLALATAEAGIP